MWNRIWLSLGALAIGAAVVRAGGVPLAAAIVVLVVCSVAMLLAGTPGSIRWLLSSRRLADVPSVLSWSCLLWRSLPILSLVVVLSGSSGPVIADGLGIYLILLYGAGKVGCAANGCCGYTPDAPRFLRDFIRLQLFEAVLAYAAGAGLLLLFCTLQTPPGTIAAWALASHLVARLALGKFRRPSLAPKPFHESSAYYQRQF